MQQVYMWTHTINSKWGDNTPDQQIDGINARTDMLDGSEDYDIGGDTSKTGIMKNRWHSRNRRNND